MATFRKGYFKLAYSSISANKIRSILTMVGIIIGVLSVIMIVSISEGVKQQIGRQTVEYGDGVLVVRPLSGQQNIFTGDSLPGGANTMLTGRDAEAIRKVPGTDLVVPLSGVSGAVAADSKLDNPYVVATSADFSNVLQHKIEHGGFFDSQNETPTAVLGYEAAQKLFEDNIPLGRTLTWRGQDFIVGGIWSKFAAVPFSIESNFNNAIFLPSDAVQGVLGSELSIYEIIIKPAADTEVNQLSKLISAALLDTRGGAKDFSVATGGAMGDGASDTFRLLTLMTVGIASIAFLVGGIGIMNMMLVSVTERIHEIGLRKALGATNRQVVNQFMAEAFTLSVVGALLGVLVSVIAIAMLRLYTSLQPAFYVPILIIAPLLAIVTGMVFGTFPALQAARKDPIEALRHE